MVSVAVTGATGFLGRHVVAALDWRGVSPTLVSRPGPVPDRLAGHPVVEMDLGHAPADVYDRMGRPEVLIHLAWGGLPNYGSPHHLEQELPAQVSFLEAVLTSGLGAVTISGSCLEYGLQSGELSEELPTAPVTAYGKAKDALRKRIEEMQERLPFRLTWARLFYLHGEGQAPGSLVPQLEAAIARGDGVFNMSGGDQLRDYLPANEAAGYLVDLALNGRNNGVVNVCSGRPVSVRELAEGVMDRHGSSIQLNLGHYPYPEYEPMAFWGDRRKLDRALVATT